MIKRWIVYGLALLGAVAFRVAYTGWLAGLVLSFVALLPLLGAVVSLPAVLSARVEVSAAPEEGERGESVVWSLSAWSRLGLPLGQVWARASAEDRLTGERMVWTERFFVPGRGAYRDRAERPEHCGLYRLRVERAWASDALGLFRLPLRRGGAAWQLILPETLEEAPELPEEAPLGLRPRPGGGPGEDYDPREYRPGDPLNIIHWKLSAKRDVLVVRETLEEIRERPVLVFDHFGAPEDLDAVLALLRGVGEGLLRKGRGFDVAWVRAGTGEMRRFRIGTGEDLRRCLTAAVSEPAPLKGRSILDLPRIAGAVSLCPGRGEEP